MYDRKKLKQDIAEDTKTIRELKVLRRESGQPRFGWQEGKGLKKAKALATRHCAAAAHIRGKIHLQGMTREQQEGLLGDLLAEYALALLAAG